MNVTVTAEEEGKPVIDANGERIGIVERVDDGTALVDACAGIDPTATRALGWMDDADVVPLREPSINTITDSRILLRSNL